MALMILDIHSDQNDCRFMMEILFFLIVKVLSLEYVQPWFSS